MVFDHEKEWILHPIEEGATGDAFMGVSDSERVFLKRNASPFITTLSAEGVTPKLKWSRKTYSGDTLIAQEWKDGYLLERTDMNQQRVVDLIRRIHYSEKLTSVLRRVGGKEYLPLDFINLYFHDLPNHLLQNSFFNQIIHYLENSINNDFYEHELTLCHGDLNHHNFLVDENETLYLVDWENVRIADSLSDITWLLCQYFPPSQWIDWFEQYKFEYDDTFYERVRWYSLINCLLLIKDYYKSNQYDKVNETVLLLQSIYKNSK